MVVPAKPLALQGPVVELLELVAEAGELRWVTWLGAYKGNENEQADC